jgi:ribonuclease P protein component
MIPSPFRFHGHNSLRYVYANGKAVRSQIATVKWVRNTHRSRPRVSVVVSKKVLKSAVGRNRIRRRLYEYIRLKLPDLPEVYDIVIIATSPDIRMMSAEDLTRQLDSLFDKAQL